MLNHLVTWLAVRGDLSGLETLDDRMLADMGLERGDLRRGLRDSLPEDGRSRGPARAAPAGWVALARHRP